MKGVRRHEGSGLQAGFLVVRPVARALMNRSSQTEGGPGRAKPTLRPAPRKGICHRVRAWFQLN
jgi:hypothetical protein